MEIYPVILGGGNLDAERRALVLDVAQAPQELGLRTDEVGGRHEVGGGIPPTARQVAVAMVMHDPGVTGSRLGPG